MSRRVSAGFEGAVRELGAASRALREAVSKQGRAVSTLATASVGTHRAAQRLDAAVARYNDVMVGIERERQALAVAALDAIDLSTQQTVRAIRLRPEGASGG